MKSGYFNGLIFEALIFSLKKDYIKFRQSFFKIAI